MVTAEKVENRLNREITAFLKTEKVLHDKSITYEGFLENKMLIIWTIRKGIPYSLFNSIQDYTPFTEKNWADFLNISIKSLAKYKATFEHIFKPIHTEKIIEMAEVTKVGLEVFEDTEKLKLWLNTPNFALGNLKPIELLKDSYGKEMVIGELTRISHGIFV